MQPQVVSLLSDDEQDEDVPIAAALKERTPRPVRAAATAAQSLSQQLAGLKGA